MHSDEDYSSVWCELEGKWHVEYIKIVVKQARPELLPHFLDDIKKCGWSLVNIPF